MSKILLIAAVIICGNFSGVRGGFLGDILGITPATAATGTAATGSVVNVVKAPFKANQPNAKALATQLKAEEAKVQETKAKLQKIVNSELSNVKTDEALLNNGNPTNPTTTTTTTAAGTNPTITAGVPGTAGTAGTAATAGTESVVNVVKANQPHPTITAGIPAGTPYTGTPAGTDATASVGTLVNAGTAATGTPAGTDATASVGTLVKAKQPQQSQTGFMGWANNPMSDGLGMNGVTDGTQLVYNGGNYY